MNTVHFVLLLLAFLLALLTSIGVTTPRVHIGWLAVALFIADFLIRGGV